MLQPLLRVAPSGWDEGLKTVETAAMPSKGKARTTSPRLILCMGWGKILTYGTAVGR